MWTNEVQTMIVKGIGETLYMTLMSTLVGYVFGLPLGIILSVSDKEGLSPNKTLYKALDVIVNITRSIPFLILLILLIPFTRLVVGRSTGSTATIIPLVVAAVPFIARMVESSINEVDRGVIEAARSMGAGNLRIITNVLLVESKTSLITGSTIAIGTILGYSAMAGTVWRRIRRYSSQIWILQIPVRHHDSNSHLINYSCSGIPVNRNVNSQ